MLACCLPTTPQEAQALDSQTGSPTSRPSTRWGHPSRGLLHQKALLSKYPSLGRFGCQPVIRLSCTCKQKYRKREGNNNSWSRRSLHHNGKRTRRENFSRISGFSFFLWVASSSVTVSAFCLGFCSLLLLTCDVTAAIVNRQCEWVQQCRVWKRKIMSSRHSLFCSPGNSDTAVSTHNAVHGSVFSIRDWYYGALSDAGASSWIMIVKSGWTSGSHIRIPSTWTAINLFFRQHTFNGFVFSCLQTVSKEKGNLPVLFFTYCMTSRSCQTQ